MILLVDGTNYTVEKSNNIFRSSVLLEFISIHKKNDHKYTLDFDNTFDLSPRSFTTLEAAFREALLIQKKYRY